MASVTSEDVGVATESAVGVAEASSFVLFGLSGVAEAGFAAFDRLVIVSRLRNSTKRTKLYHNSKNVKKGFNIRVIDWLSVPQNRLIRSVDGTTLNQNDKMSDAVS